MPMRRQFLALCATAPFAGPLFAQADAGEYRILHARYGSAEHNVDVTDRLRDLARGDRPIRVDNQTFGVDPHPNEVKTLRIFTRERGGGRPHTFEYDEGDVIDGRRFVGWAGGDWGRERWDGGWGPGGRRPPMPPRADDGEWQVLQALYGNPERHADVTARLRELAREDRPFRVSNARLGGDPDPLRVKVLRVHARSRDGQWRSFEFTEGSEVDARRFTGWPGGAVDAGWGEERLPGSNRDGYGPQAGWGYLNIVTAGYGTPERQLDVTYRLRGAVRGDRLDVRAANDLAGVDPVPGTPKALWVVYTLGGGPEQRLRVREGEVLRLP